MSGITAVPSFGFNPLSALQSKRAEPDWSSIYHAMGRSKGVTLTLAWQEYKAVHPDGYQLSWFSDAPIP